MTNIQTMFDRLARASKIVFGFQDFRYILAEEISIPLFCSPAKVEGTGTSQFGFEHAWRPDAMTSKLNSQKALQFDNSENNSESSFEVIDMDTSFTSKPGDFKFNTFTPNTSYNSNFSGNSTNTRPSAFPQPLS